MSKFLNIFAPAGVGAAGILTGAYILADQFVVDIPAPLREAVEVRAAQAQEIAAQAEADAAAAAEAMAAENAARMMAGLAPSQDGGYGLGRPALPEEIAAWDIDVRPDGLGLPVGSGDVWTGEELYIQNCASCHGDFGEAVDRWPQLAMGYGTLDREDPVKTVGSYWPYASTVFDYVHRAMPFGQAQTLSDDDVYAIVAYILYLNEIVEDDFVLSNETFTEVVMPNADGFFFDDREETELSVWTGEPCMENCKDDVEITMRAMVLDVTPESDDGSAAEATEAAMETADEAPAEEAPAATEAAAEAGAAEAEEAPAEEAAADEAPAEEAMTAAVDPALAEAGAGVFRQCQACHQVGEGAQNRTGPMLNGIIGAPIGAVEGFRYSKTFEEAHDAGRTWTVDELSAFLADPRGSMRGTKMSFNGLRSQEDIDAVLAYIQSESP